MEINETTYILGYWFASDGEDNWYLIMTKQDGEWKGQYTFRYNKGEDDPFIDLDKDDKNIYLFNPPKDEPEEEVINKIDALFETIKIKYSDYHDKFLVQGNTEKFMEIAKTKHYLHFKQVQ